MTITIQALEPVPGKDELYIGAQYCHAFTNPKENPSLPNVLLIGDSISIGYAMEVRQQLKGKAMFILPRKGMCVWAEK